ncbi:acyl-CoA dehydrogenase family protein [Paenibacillus qinlingensis]|uniref:Alkylation response protein AidB-like acyl-CoA dehydrogenase n=1 Tax=Paenibacillus qinlingensis TaxID=1837343 RepID=A0ABU1P018_9BACL|nr:acyl-CoA dehydrogenase family protein [Paenibacillus qinlingensis]MDR6552681.1 alkylation response protein AidB-like acyl-CoA dehydrogenase [Paenibacillus qinlingensis]
MDYSLSEELEMIRSMVRDFAAGEVAPKSVLRDEEERFDRSLFKSMGELGLAGILVPEAYGGLGLDAFTHSLVLEELARACASTGYTLFVHSALASAAISMFGTEEQKQLYLGPMGSAVKLGAFTWSDINLELHTSAVRDGDEYVLRGTKAFVTNAAEADIFVVFAATGDDLSVHGCSAFILEKGTPGFVLGKKEKKLGTLGAPSLSLELVDCRIPVANRLGEEGDGYQIASRTLESARSGIAALAVGLAQAAMEAAIAYAKTRMQFGKPIAQQQAVAFKLANMAVHIEAARLLTYQAAWRESQGGGADGGEKDIGNGNDNDNVNSKKLISNLFAGETVMAVTIEAVQTLGGYGYTKAFPVERYMRDAKMLQMVEATMEEQQRAIVRLMSKK